MVSPGSVMAKVRSLKWHLITVEPIMFLSALAAGLSGPTNAAILYRKVCLNMYDPNICNNLEADGNKEYLDQTQKMTSKWAFYETIVYTIPALLAVAMYGSWSDRFSRKVPLMIAPLGSILVIINYLINAIYIESSVAFLLLGSFIYGISGGYTVILMAVFSYLSDITGLEGRTSRISIVYGCQSLAYALSSFTSGLILEHLGYVFVYTVTLILHVISLLYIIIRIKDIQPHDRQQTDQINDQEESNQIQIQSIETPFKDFTLRRKIIELFGLKNFKNSLLVTFRKRTGRVRQCILLLVGILFFLIFTSAGGSFYLFVRHPPISFSQTLYGYYAGYNSLITFSSQIAFIPFIKSHIHVSDHGLLVIAVVFDMIGRLWFGFCVTAWMVFLSPIIGYIMPATFTCIRGLVASMVRPDELGKIFGVIAWLEGLSALFGSLLYSEFLYPASVEVYAGFVFIVSAILCIIPLGLVVWLYVIMKQQGVGCLQNDVPPDDIPVSATVQANELIDKMQAHSDTPGQNAGSQ